MRATVSRTKRATGVNVPYTRDRIGITVIMPREDFEKLKTVALRNCRSLTAECLYRILQTLKAEAGH